MRSLARLSFVPGTALVLREHRALESPVSRARTLRFDFKLSLAGATAGRSAGCRRCRASHEQGAASPVAQRANSAREIVRGSACTRFEVGFGLTSCQ
jgi:hypothetical protein